MFDFNQGKRYIIYDPIFINDIASQSGDYDWAQIAIFAHEIGHQVLGHVLKDVTTVLVQRQLELQADKFAGVVLAHWGASLSNSQALMRSLKVYDHAGISDHPNSDQRVAAMTLGWEEGCTEMGSECNSPLAKVHGGSNQMLTNDLPDGYTPTANYTQFIQWANRLKGALINEEYCQQYVTLAIAQANSSIQHKCGYEASGYGESKQWSKNEPEQFKWCMGASAYATEREAKFREKKLAKCVVKEPLIK